MSDEPDDAQPGPRIFRIQCECGGPLGTVTLPTEDAVFHAVCPGCGTRYRRSIAQLTNVEGPETTAVVILPRARPRG